MNTKEQLIIPDDQCIGLGCAVSIGAEADWIDDQGNEYDRITTPDLYRYASKEDYTHKNPIPEFIRDEHGNAKVNIAFVNAPFRLELFRQRKTGLVFSALMSAPTYQATCES